MTFSKRLGLEFANFIRVSRVTFFYAKRCRCERTTPHSTPHHHPRALLRMESWRNITIQPAPYDVHFLNRVLKKIFRTLICELSFAFRSTEVFKTDFRAQNKSKQTVVHLLVCHRSTLLSTTCSPNVSPSC